MTQIMNEASELMLLQRTCAINGCKKPHLARGWCRRHYNRWHRHGDPLGGGDVPGAAREFLESVVVPFSGDECLIWPFSRDGKGYGKIRRGGKSHYTHRLACEIVHGQAPTSKHYAAHNCGKGHLGCCNPRHVRWATPKENQADRLIHGTHIYGSKTAGAKLTEEAVRAIRTSHKSVGQLAREFGVTPGAISCAKSGKSWAWLGGVK